MSPWGNKDKKKAVRERVLADALKSVVRFFTVPDPVHFRNVEDIVSFLERTVSTEIRKANASGGLTLRQKELVEAAKAVASFLREDSFLSPVDKDNLVLFLSSIIHGREAA